MTDHTDTRHTSATVAGADVVPDLVLSHSTLDADVFEDPEVFAAFLAALVALPSSTTVRRRTSRPDRGVRLLHRFHHVMQANRRFSW